MSRFIVYLLLATGAWFGFKEYKAREQKALVQEGTIEWSQPSSPRARTVELSARFQCDGRTYCSQMTSCEEATFFLKNCPGTKMDGNNDGIPCEKQWCK